MGQTNENMMLSSFEDSASGHPRFSPVGFVRSLEHPWSGGGIGQEILRSGIDLARISLARCPRRCPPQTCQQCVWRQKASRDISSIGTVVNSDSSTAAPAALGSDPDQLPIIISGRIAARDLKSASGVAHLCRQARAPALGSPGTFLAPLTPPNIRLLKLLRECDRVRCSAHWPLGVCKTCDSPTMACQGLQDTQAYRSFNICRHYMLKGPCQVGADFCAWIKSL